jgi:hypothetical protein
MSRRRAPARAARVSFDKRGGTLLASAEALADIGIDFLLVGKIEGDRSIHLFQSQRREVLANRLRRVTRLETRRAA